MVKGVRQVRGIASAATGRRSSRSSTGERGDREKQRNEDRGARKAELLEAAVNVIRRDGPGVSMDRMAAEAGVTKPILYRHFHDRAGLVKAIAEYAYASIAIGLDEALHSDVKPRELVVSAIDVYLRFIETDPSLYRFLVHRTIAETSDPSSVLSDFISRSGRQVALVLGEGLRAAGLDSGPAEPWAFGIVGMVHSAGDWWMESGTMPRTRLAEYLANLIYDGIPNIDQIGTSGTWLSADNPVAEAPVPSKRPTSTDYESEIHDVTSINRTKRKSI